MQIRSVIPTETVTTTVLTTDSEDTVTTTTTTAVSQVMISDGVSQSPEDATWLLELLNKPPRADIGEYAQLILSAAEKNRECIDDMSVSVIRILKTEEQKYA